MNESELKHLQRCELLVANQIKRICEKNHIQYFMVAGSVLGAVRHKGFIPWDDDMDFGMVRCEYERFCKVCKTDLGEEFDLQTWDTDENYPFSFGKIRLKKTKVEELFAAPRNEKNGIFVDIFPFDNAPDDKKLRAKQSKIYFFCKRALWIKKRYGKNIKTKGLTQKAKYNFFYLLCCFLPYSCLKKEFDKIIKQYNGMETECLVFDAPYSYHKNMVKREWLKEISYYDFGEYQFPAFKDYDAYLSHLYGDYMKLPSLEQRHSHDILDVDFAGY